MATITTNNLIVIFLILVTLASLVLVYLTNRKIKKGIVKPKIKSVKLKPAKAIKPQVIEDKYKGYDAIRHGKKKWSLKYWQSHLKDRLFPQKSVLINMELMNGMNRHFITLLKDDNTFKYRGKMYLADNEMKYYIIDSKIWAYDFHEDLSVPVKRKIPLTKIKATVESSGISEVEYMLSPKTLERFSISKIAEGIMKGQQIDEFFKRVQLLLIITMSAAVIHLVLFMFKSGMLQQIKIPGVT